MKDVPNPKNVSELKSYLGLFTYYSKFLLNMADVLAPLYKLLHKNVHWRWTNVDEKAFKLRKIYWHPILCLCISTQTLS